MLPFLNFYFFLIIVQMTIFIKQKSDTELARKASCSVLRRDFVALGKKSATPDFFPFFLKATN
jgi:hypothetical protein